MPTIINQVNSTHNADNHVVIELQDGAELEVSAPVQAVSIVLSNLLRNACNYTHEGLVSVKIEADSVSIGDNGEGIAAAEIERIQQPFQRSSSQADGYGLGLDIVRRLCERFGWELDIRSEVGKGTVVRVRF